MSGFDPSIIERARAVDLLTVAEAHGLKLAKRAHEYIGPCPHCGGTDRFNVNPTKAVFLCRRCNAAGGSGAIDLEIFISGCSFPAAIEALTGEAMPSADEARAAAAKRRVQEKETQAGQVKTARWLWAKQQPPHGTAVETYLRVRGFRGAIPPTIGFLPADGDYPPAMIAAYAAPCEVDETLRAPHEADVHAVHITRLLADGSDRRREAGVKITIGAPLGYPIALAAITDGLSLTLCEGIEDGLAFVGAGFPAWAAGSAVYLPALEPLIPACLETLIIERHPDDASHRAIESLRRSLLTREHPPHFVIREAVA